MLIYDVGMHNGDDTAYYLAKGARVVAIEANPRLCEAASRRFAAEIAAGRLTILNIAVGDGEGDVSFHVHTSNSVLSSLAPISGAERITVQLRRLSEVFDEHGLPDFAKIDVEHVDHVVLAELRRNGRLPRAISVEAHREEVFDEVVAAGYRAFRLVNGAKVPRHFGAHRIEAVTGEALPWSFPAHSSGPFGADLPDEWMDAAAARYLWRHRERLRGAGWYDLHASLDATASLIGGRDGVPGEGRLARRSLTYPVQEPPTGKAVEARGARVYTYPDWNVIAPGRGAYIRPSRHAKPKHFQLVAAAQGQQATFDYRRPVRRIAADTPVILIGGDRNYYHHLVDFMLRLFSVVEPWPENARFLVRDFGQFHVQMREFLGITAERLIEHDGKEVPLRCDRLVVPPSPVGPKGRVVDPGAIERLRAAVTARLPPQTAPATRLFISRGQAAKRRLADEDAIWARLEPLGFRRVVLEEMTFGDQVAAFAAAECIVGVHGAGLANMVFSPPGALIVQIMPDPGTLYAGYFNRLAPGCGHRIVDVPAEGRREDAEVRVNPDEVIRALPWRPAAAATSATADAGAGASLAFAAPAFAHIARVGLRAALLVANAPADARRIDFELRGSRTGQPFVRHETRDLPAPDPVGAPVELVFTTVEDDLAPGQHLLCATLRDAGGRSLGTAQAMVSALGIQDLPLPPDLLAPLRSTTLQALPLVPLGADAADRSDDVRIEMRKPSNVPLVRLTQSDFEAIRATGAPAKRFSLPSYQLNGLYVASLKAPTVFGQYGTVATHDGVVGESWMHYHPRIPPIYQLRAFMKRPSAEEDCGDVGMWWGAPWRLEGHNYYHTHGEALCALLQLEIFRDLSGVPEFEILMPTLAGWPGEAIELMGIDRVRFIGDRALRPRRLYWASAVLRHNLGIEPLLKQVFRRVRLGVERRLAAGTVTTPPAIADAEMVYVSRLDSAVRPMRNEAELIAGLEARGVRIFVSRGLSYAEQVLGMSRARVVIGPHGAGLTNIGYARPDALVVEIHPGFYVTPLFFRMSQVLGQRYRCYTQPHTPIPGDDEKAWTIDVEAFLGFLDRALEADAAAHARSSDSGRLDGAS